MRDDKHWPCYAQIREAKLKKRTTEHTILNRNPSVLVCTFSSHGRHSGTIVGVLPNNGRSISAYRSLSTNQFLADFTVISCNQKHDVVTIQVEDVAA